MNKLTVLPKIVLLVVVALCIVAPPALAQDMAKVAPTMVKVVLDNDRVRVLDVQVKAGDKLPMHSHPASFVYGMNTGKVKTTLADGKTQEIEYKMGDARWR